MTSMTTTTSVHRQPSDNRNSKAAGAESTRQRGDAPDVGAWAGAWAAAAAALGSLPFPAEPTPAGRHGGLRLDPRPRPLAPASVGTGSAAAGRATAAKAESGQQHAAGQAFRAAGTEPAPAHAHKGGTAAPDGSAAVRGAGHNHHPLNRRSSRAATAGAPADPKVAADPKATAAVHGSVAAAATPRMAQAAGSGPAQAAVQTAAKPSGVAGDLPTGEVVGGTAPSLPGVQGAGLAAHARAGQSVPPSKAGGGAAPTKGDVAPGSQASASSAAQGGATTAGGGASAGGSTAAAGPEGSQGMQIPSGAPHHGAVPAAPVPQIHADGGSSAPVAGVPLAGAGAPGHAAGSGGHGPAGAAAVQATASAPAAGGGQPQGTGAAGQAPAAVQVAAQPISTPPANAAVPVGAAATHADAGTNQSGHAGRTGRVAGVSGTPAARAGADGAAGSSLRSMTRSAPSASSSGGNDDTAPAAAIAAGPAPLPATARGGRRARQARAMQTPRPAWDPDLVKEPQQLDPLQGGLRLGSQPSWRGRLDGGQLGPLGVRVEAHQGVIGAFFQANAGAANALQQSSGQLATQLGQQGLTLGQFGVNGQAAGGAGAQGGQTGQGGQGSAWYGAASTDARDGGRNAQPSGTWAGVGSRTAGGRDWRM